MLGQDWVATGLLIKPGTNRFRCIKNRFGFESSHATGSHGADRGRETLGAVGRTRSRDARPNLHRLKSVRCWLVCLLVACGCLSLMAIGRPLWGQEANLVADARIDRIMYADPKLVIPKVELFVPEDLKPLWLQALRRPDAELRRLAADSAVLAYRRGLREMNDFHASLAACLTDPQSQPDVRRAAAHALVVIQAKAYAESLAKEAERGGLDLALTVEPALAEWDYQPYRAVWRERLGREGIERHRLLLAIDGLGRVRDTDSFAGLRSFIFDARQPFSVRLSAVRAAAQIATEGLVEDADQLIQASSTDQRLGRILAVELLTQHRDPAAVALLQKLAVDSESVVAGKALRRLFELDPKLVQPFAAQIMTHRDVNLRRVAAETLANQGDLAAIPLLASLLDDENPGLRQSVTTALVQLGSMPSLQMEVITQCTQILGRDSWRGIEQAAIVLVELDHQPAGVRFVELLNHPRQEAAVAAAWGLRRLAISEHLPAMLAHAQKMRTEFTQPSFPYYTRAVAQLSQLFQAFGLQRYREAEPLMRQFIPKDFLLGDEARGAAIWALGYLYEDAAPADLSEAFEARLADVNSPLPEVPDVRLMSAVSLGRMKSPGVVETLKRFHRDEGPAPIGLACGWALERITGKSYPVPADVRTPLRDWFLVPID